MDEWNSLAKGLRIGWFTIVVGYLFVGMAAALLVMIGISPSQLGPAVEWTAFLLPWLGFVGAVGFHLVHGERRTAAGIGLAVPSMLGFLLLLVAACHGLAWLAYR